MKLKYYLYGFGFGIMFATIILSISFYLRTENKTTMTDTEIIEHAKRLGMIEKEEIKKTSETETTIQTQSQETSLEETPTQATTQKETVSESLEETTQKESTTEQETITVPETTKEEIDTTVLETTEQNAESEDFSQGETSKGEKAVITVQGGMSSEEIAKLLEKNGIIEDASDFNRYVVVNGYSSRMRVGVYEVPFNADYETLIKIFCN